jgi:membrane-bound lytic murein transglycosylase D
MRSPHLARRQVCGSPIHRTGLGLALLALGLVVLAGVTPGVHSAGQPDAAESEAWQAVLREAGPSPAGQARLLQLQAVFDAAQVPRELVWLAEVESSFNPAARSRAGAVGLYQLMPLTAKSLGLSLEPTDERLIPEENARAAARYLRHLYRRFGDWSLVLAAYNAGETRVHRLLAETEANNFEMIAPLLPAETRAYVPKMESVLRRRERCGLSDLPPPGVRLASSR